MEQTEDVLDDNIDFYEDFPFESIEVDTPAKLNMMIYGIPGSGKTVLASTATLCKEMSPVLYIDVEGGALSMRDFYNKKNIKIVRPVVFDVDMERYYSYLVSKKNVFRTVVIDTTTEAQKLSMLTIMNRLYESRPDKVGSQPSLQEWGKNSDAVRKFVRYYKNIPNVNTIFIAHAQEVKDEQSGAIVTKPSFSGKLPEELCGFVDIVGRLVETTKRGENDNEVKYSNAILFKSTNGGYISKDRSNRLPYVMHNPTMGQIYELAITRKGE